MNEIIQNDVLIKVLEDKKEFENEFTGYLQGLKCKVCNKSLKTNTKHAKYYDKGWKPECHKKCQNVLYFFE